MEFITKQEVKDILGINERTYQKYLADGILKPYKISDNSKISKFNKTEVEGILKRPKEAKVITIANNKGGVGKTMTAYNVAMKISEMGKKVLAIDMDIQGNFSYILNIDIDSLTLKNFTNIDIKKITDNLDILPANISLSTLDLEIQTKINRELWLEKNIISQVKNKYDYIIIDTSPSINILNLNAFSSSDLVLIVINPDTLSLIGADTIIDILKEIRENISEKIRYKMFINKFTKGRVISQEIMNAIPEKYGDKLLNIAVPLAEKIAYSIATKTPIKDKDVSEQFDKIADFIIGGIYE